MKRYFLGIDIGTFESRGILIDESFRVAADASVPHGMDNPQPGWFEQEAEAVWWGDLCKLCRTLIQQSGIRPEQIACVGTSALGTDCLPVDEQCRPLRPAILYGIDARASEEAAWLTEHYGQARVQELFGHPICSGDTATKILWLRRHEPEIYAKTAYFLTGSSFLTARLTGKYVIDQSLAKGSFRPLYRADGSVNEAECGLYCRPDQIAACAWSTDIVGTVTPALPRERRSLPVPVTPRQRPSAWVWWSRARPFFSMAPRCSITIVRITSWAAMFRRRATAPSRVGRRLPCRAPIVWATAPMRRAH